MERGGGETAGIRGRGGEGKCQGERGETAGVRGRGGERRQGIGGEEGRDSRY